MTNSYLPIMNSCARSIGGWTSALFHHINKSSPFHWFSNTPVMVYFNWEQNEILSRFQNVSPGPWISLENESSTHFLLHSSVRTQDKCPCFKRAARYLNIPQPHHASEARCFYLYPRHVRQSSPINLKPVMLLFHFNLVLMKNLPLF